MEQLHTQTMQTRNYRSVKSNVPNLFKFVGQCLLLASLTAGLIACGGVQDQDLRDYVNQVKARQKGNIPPLPQPQKFEIYSYDEASVRDPFIPTTVIEAAENKESGPRPEVGRVKDVLEEFPLGSLKMMGSLEKDGKRWALMRAPDGTLHRTTAGHYVGQNNGKILKISESQLELKEIVPDGLGGWVERFSTLTVNE